MTYTNDNWRMAMTKLIKMTSTGEVKWEPSELYAGSASNEVFRSFECRIAGKTYVVTSIKSKSRLDDVAHIWGGGYDFSIYEVGFKTLFIGSAPRDVSMIKSLYDAAEQSFTFQRKALDGLL